uniref:nicotinate-nucleotide diphosphorylase (carboxylating) n=1 Tax=Schlesneria paludicola TaxID=360056 RepID=A0A7C2JZD3_9PLAN
MTVEQTFQAREQASASTLVYLGLSEDLGAGGDLTCAALIDPQQRATVNVVARQPGVLAGAPVGRMVFAQLDASISWTAKKQDGDRVAGGDVVATVSGPLDKLLIGERTMLNFLTHLSGIATLTRRFVDAVVGTEAQILDTRKTLPGYRVLEKYAVRCGGGTNHRLGLYDGVLIKDNHLAAWTASRSIADAVRAARAKSPPGVSIEVEVDTLEQLRDALEGRPDIVLLDNMPPAMLREAVAIRDAFVASLSPPSPDGGLMRQNLSKEAPDPRSGDRGLSVLLEASGGVTLDTVREIALTRVERISIGALTHSAPALDLAFDWNSADAQG